MQKSSATSSRHVCHCGKSYLRKEHLQRHQQATHSAQLFNCHICGRSYSRNDILQRHLTTHEDSHQARSRACDACHANKTKCDGNGDSCTLCAKREIACVYSEAQSRGLRGRYKRPGPNHRMPTNQLAQRGTPEIREEASSASTQARDDPCSQHDSLTTDSTVDPEISNSPICLEMILRGLSTSPPPTHLQHSDSSNTLKRWLQTCFQSFVAHFHHRWHIITAPTYELNEKPCDSTASIAIIGCYCLNRENWDYAIIGIHDQLVDRYLHLLAEDGNFPETMRRLETYQSILMNIIFGLYLGQERTITRANSLCGLLIATFQRTGFFNQSHAQHIQQNDYPGSYGPWVDMVTDEWKRLVSNLVKVEARLSIIFQQHPRLLHDDLDAFLPSTFSLRNCYRMDIFLRRQQLEPPGRSQVKMSWMIQHPDVFLPDLLLVEDIHLGLCGLASDSLRQADDPSTRDAIMQRLAIWAKHLGTLAKKLTSYPMDSSFLAAYLGEENETDGAHINDSLVRPRVRNLIREATVLYHLLHILSSADLRIIAHLKTKALASSESQDQVRPDEASSVLRNWAGSIEGRTSLLHALSILSIIDTYLGKDGSESIHQFHDPIYHASTAFSALVLAGWLTHTDVTCSCAMSTGQVNLAAKSWDLDVDAAAQAWVRDGGRASFQGRALCKCSTNIWVERFVAHLPKKGWEIVGVIASILRRWQGAGIYSDTAF